VRAARCGGPHSAFGAGSPTSAAPPDRLLPKGAGRRTETTIDVSSIEDRRSATEPDADVSLRIRTATADAAFVSEGIALGLPLKWIERAPLSEHRPMLALAWRAPAGGTRVSSDH
jgi:hypothetical protein